MKLGEKSGVCLYFFFLYKLLGLGSCESFKSFFFFFFFFLKRRFCFCFRETFEILQSSVQAAASCGLAEIQKCLEVPV